MSTTELSELEKNKELYPISTKINNKGHLIIGDCNVIDLVKKYGTPLYVINKESLTSKCNEYINSLKKHYNDFLVLYAAKAFATPAIYKIVNKLGLGLDVVSGGEIFLALKSGFNKTNIYFHGNNKQKDEIELSIQNNIGKLVCDNFHEIHLIQDIAQRHNKKVSILLRLTPGIECHTHEYIKTGHLDSKFGFDLEQYDEALSLIKSKCMNLIPVGLHAHIGSQIFEISSYIDTIDILLEYFVKAKEKHGFSFSELNIGGGVGISYTSKDDPFLISKWAKYITDAIKNNCKKHNLKLPKLICEPGRSLIATSGITLYTAGSSKQVPGGRKYIAVDGGMADNPRPITYQAEYTAVVANKMNSKNNERVTIAGRYCESGDILIKDIVLPEIVPGDIIAVLSTGAYNYSMSSNYNMVPRPACILVEGGNSEIIIEKETYADLISKHKIPQKI